MSIIFKIDLEIKTMDKIFWAYFHSGMFWILLIILIINVIVNDRKEFKKGQYSENKSESSVGEIVMLIIIFCVIMSLVIWVLFNVALRNSLVATWFVGIFGIVYVYIAIKQIIKIIFVPENRAFSFVDIKNFVYTYMFWWLMVVAVNSSQPVVNILTEIVSTHRDIVKVGMLFLWFYFNTLFAMGGIYIFLYYLWIIGNRVVKRFPGVEGKIRKFLDIICGFGEKGGKYTGLKSFYLWRDNRKGIVYKIIMTLPLLLYDIGYVAYLLARVFIGMMFGVGIVLVCDPIRDLYKCIGKLWNKHKNNEWMYVLAQVAGLGSYIIVFIIIQYGKYEEVTRTVYEFVGTIILIPYFLSKIVNIRKELKGNSIEESIKEENR